MRIHLGGSWHNLPRHADGGANGFNPPDPASWTPEERTTVTFIRDWLRGEGNFSFQTSGSTGDPKTVTFARWQLEASAALSAKGLNLRQGATSLLCLDPAFVAGRMMIARSLVVGMDLVVRRPAANPLQELPSAIDFAAFVPLQLATVLAEAPNALDRISTIIVGGAPIPSSVSRQLEGRKCTVYATYGMTETLTHIALQRLNPEFQDAYHLLPGIVAASDEDGCMVVSASHLGSAIVTRDIVEWVTPSSFRLLGRADNIINTGGIKVLPQKVEAAVHIAMKELAIETRFFVAGQPDDRLGERVCLVIEGTPLPDSKAKPLLAALTERLGVYERPREIIYRSVFQETPTRKVNRRATLASPEDGGRG